MANELNIEGSFNIPIQDVQDSQVNITQILGKSVQYQDMIEQLETLEEYFALIPEEAEEKRLITSQKIEKQKQFIELFKADVLRLAEQFNRIEINTERLKRAKEYFDNGKFERARNVLEDDLEQMQDEQRSLLIKQEEYENEVLPRLKNNSEEYFILALSTRTNYANPKWLADTCTYFEQSIKSYANENNVFQYALFLQKHNHFNEAEKYYQQYLQKFASSLSPDIRARVLNNLAVLHKAKNEYERSLAEYEEALAIYRNLAQSNPSAYLLDVAKTLNNLAVLHKAKNEYDQALVEHKEALSIRRNLAQSNPSAYLPDVATTLNNLANLHQVRNEHDQALSKYEEALNIRRNLAQSNPSAYLPDVAGTLNNLGLLYKAKNEYERSLAEYEEALNIRRNLAQSNPSAYLPDVTMILNNLAVLHQTKNEYERSLAEYEEALAIYRNLAQSNPSAFLPDVAMTLMNLSIFYLQAKPDQEKSVGQEIEAITILLPIVEKVPYTQSYLQKALAVLQRWGLSEVEIQSLIDKHSSHK